MSLDLGNLLAVGLNTGPLQTLLQELLDTVHSQQNAIEYLKGELALRGTVEEGTSLQRELQATKEELRRTKEELLQSQAEQRAELQTQINETNEKLNSFMEICPSRDELKEADELMRNALAQEKGGIMAEVAKVMDFAKDVDIRCTETLKEGKETRERANRLASDVQTMNTKLTQTVQRCDQITERVEAVAQTTHAELRQVKSNVASHSEKTSRALAETQQAIFEEREAATRAGDAVFCLYETLGLDVESVRQQVASQAQNPRDAPFLCMLDDRVAAIEKDISERIHAQHVELQSRLGETKSQLAGLLSQRSNLEELLQKQQEAWAPNLDKIVELQKRVDIMQVAQDRLSRSLDAKCGVDQLNEKANKADFQISVQAIVQQIEAMHASQMRVLNAAAELDTMHEVLEAKADKKDIEHLLGHASVSPGAEDPGIALQVKCLSCNRRAPQASAPSIPSVDLGAQFAESLAVSTGRPPSARSVRAPSPSLSTVRTSQSQSQIWESATPRRPTTPTTRPRSSSSSTSLATPTPATKSQPFRF